MDLDPAQLRALATAVDEGSLDGAARRLHVTPSAVSQRLRALEAAVGRVLLVRTRPVAVTEAGEVVLRLARQVDLLGAEASAELGLAQDDGAPVVALAVNADSLATWVLPALTPLVGSLRLQLSTANEDSTAALLRDGSVVGAVTAEAEPAPGCRATVLGALRYRAVATPDVVARWFPDGVGAAALARAPAVVLDRDDDLQHAFLRRHAGTGAAVGLRVHQVPSSADFVDAVRLGWGWAMVPDLQAEPDLETGRLVDLAPGESLDVVLHWQRWRSGGAALDRVTAALTSYAARVLVPA